ncbi:hypothetical protein [Glycomyces arizonensis]|uniref:hypothetical protein n=1 Tax=Glycomyces arizonensis TaxID=256035 RepID=UPI000416054B|nr:hypothetical protein [Glycomyces arizonensis]
MAQQRQFDPEAIEEYRLFLDELIDALENRVLPVLSTGTLSRAPAFGTAPGAAENAAARYLEFHAATWRNLQYLRGTLHGLEASLAATAAGGDAAEEESAVLFTGAGADLDGTIENSTAADGTLWGTVDSGTAESGYAEGTVIGDAVDGGSGDATVLDS